MKPGITLTACAFGLALWHQPARAQGQFDGQWTGTYECGPHATKPLPAFSWPVRIDIKNGSISGRHDYQMRLANGGQAPASVSFSGTIDAIGDAKITAVARKSDQTEDFHQILVKSVATATEITLAGPMLGSGDVPLRDCSLTLRMTVPDQQMAAAGVSATPPPLQLPEVPHYTTSAAIAPPPAQEPQRVEPTPPPPAPPAPTVIEQSPAQDFESQVKQLQQSSSNKYISVTIPNFILDQQNVWTESRLYRDRLEFFANMNDPRVGSPFWYKLLGSNYLRPDGSSGFIWHFGNLNPCSELKQPVEESPIGYSKLTGQVCLQHNRMEFRVDWHTETRGAMTDTMKSIGNCRVLPSGDCDQSFSATFVALPK